METTSAIVCDPAISIAEDRTMFYLKAGFHMIADLIAICDHMETSLKAGFHMIADRRSQIADSNKVCDRLRSYTSAIVCDLRSAIRDHMETSLYVLSSAIVCDRLRS